MKQTQKIIMVCILTLLLSTVAFGGTITGSRTGASLSRVGTITGSKTGTITGSRTGTITGSGTVSTSVETQSLDRSSTRDALVYRLALLLISLPWH
jgi:hypothetical protein